MKLRTILYGYEMKNGQMVVVENEAAVVRNIFALYIEGKSLKEIAQGLTEQGITDYLEKNEWNKNMVSRILDNPNYVGEGEYPSIISKADFELATKRKSKMGGTQTELPAITTLIKSKTVCAQCGRKIGRINKWRSREKWVCPNSCKVDMYYGDKELLGGTLAVLNQAVQSPDMLSAVSSSGAYEPTLEITRQEKEIERMMEQSGIEFGVISKMALQCVAHKYECCPYDKSLALTEALIEKFGSMPMLSELDSDLVRTTITQISINRDGTLTVEFINGAEITSRYRKENTNE